MPEITLTEDQFRVVAETPGAVVVRDPAGNELGVLDPTEAAIVRKWHERRAAGPPADLIPAADVRAHLAALRAEWDRAGGLDPAQAVAFVRQLRPIPPR